MATTLEREIKLRFDDPEEARAAVIAAGGTLLRGRRLQDDCLLDTADGFLRERGSVLRVRQESGTSLLTFKGPVQPSVMKLREELETAVGDGTLVLRLLKISDLTLAGRLLYACTQGNGVFVRELK